MIPNNELPKFELKLPSSGRKTSFRPFTVREEKLLLMAVESNDNKDIIDTTLQVIQNCCLDKSLEVDKLPFFDIDYIFIALRAKSIGESITVDYTCGNCSHVFPGKIDISQHKVKKSDRKKNIDLGNMIFTMKYPNYATMKIINEDEHIINKKTAVIVGSIHYVTQKDQVYHVGKDMFEGEAFELIEGLTRGQFKKLEEFVDDFPTVVVENKTKCPKCKNESTQEYDDFTSFFV